VNDDEEDATNLLPQVMIEIQRREAACKGGYPFSLTREGTTNCKNLEAQLQPTVFAKRWLKSRAFLVDPIRAFCIAEAIDRSRWNHVSAAAGIVFDRCRIVDFCEGFDATQMRIWTEAAFESISIGGLSI